MLTRNRLQAILTALPVTIVNVVYRYYYVACHVQSRDHVVLRRPDGVTIAWMPKDDTYLEVPRLLNGRVGIDSLSATDDMFAARMNDGHVVTWGYDENGKVMDIPTNEFPIVDKICSTSSTFAALTTDGHVYNWGMRMMRRNMWKGVQNVYTTQWGTFTWMQTNTLKIERGDELVNTITDVTKITHCKYLVAALTTSGKLYLWGGSGYLSGNMNEHGTVQKVFEENATDIYQQNDSITITRSDGKFLTLTYELVRISVDDEDVLRWEEPSSFKTSKMHDGYIEFGHIEDIMSYRLTFLDDLEFKLPTSSEVDYGRADQFIVAGDVKKLILFARTTNGTLLKWNSKKVREQSGDEQSGDEQSEDELLSYFSSGFIEQGTVVHEHVEDVQHMEGLIAVLLCTGHVIVYNTQTMDVVFKDQRYYSNISKISSHFHTDLFVLTLQSNKEVVLFNGSQTKIISVN